MVARRLATVVGLGAAILTSTVAVAAGVCGDADRSGAVTVTDGVQVLRAAAELSSICTDGPLPCDVDGSGCATSTLFSIAGSGDLATWPSPADAGRATGLRTFRFRTGALVAGDSMAETNLVR